MEYATGPDISYHQGTVDWTKLAARSDFVSIRACYASTVNDSKFAVYWPSAKAQRLPRMSYHFVDYRGGALTQARMHAARIKDDPPEIYPVMDLEYYPEFGSPSRTALINFAYAYVMELEKLTGRTVATYTNPNWILYVLKPAPRWMLERPLWVAHWITGPAPIIGEFPTWDFWQFTAKGPGAEYGVQSAGIDLNRFNGTKADLWRRIGWSAPVGSVEERVQKLETRVTSLEQFVCKWCHSMVPGLENCPYCGGPQGI